MGAVAGATVLAVFATKLLGATPIGRAVAVASASAFMTAFPASGYFAPAGALCALYVDQVMGNGPLAFLGFKYALFPSTAGTIFLLVVTRALAFVLAQPLRVIESMRHNRRTIEALMKKGSSGAST